MVFAWAEPPNAKSAGKPAGARCGVQGTFALGGNNATAANRARRAACYARATNYGRLGSYVVAATGSTRLEAASPLAYSS
jgi:hypothetical protein